MENIVASGIKVELNKQKVKEIIRNYTKTEYKVFFDGFFKGSPEDKSSWVAKTIEKMEKLGWEFYQRIPDECIIFCKKHTDDELAEALLRVIEVKEEK